MCFTLLLYHQRMQHRGAPERKFSEREEKREWDLIVVCIFHRHRTRVWRSHMQTR